MNKKLTLDFWINSLKSGPKFYKTADLMKLSGLSYTACRAAASRLTQKKLLIHIGKELFGNMLSGFSAEEAACQAYQPSYISCEYILSRHGVMDQMPVIMTTVTLKRGKKLKIGQTEVFYAHLRKNLFWGFVQEGDAFVAEPEKALLDWLYLNSKVEKRLDEINWDMLDIEKLKKYVAKFPSDVKKRLGPFTRDIY